MMDKDKAVAILYMATHGRSVKTDKLLKATEWYLNHFGLKASDMALLQMKIWTEEETGASSAPYRHISAQV